MKALILAVALIPAVSLGQVCVGPSMNCDAQPTGPTELCVSSCTPVSYGWYGDMAIAISQLSNGYPVMGWSGPCLSVDRSQCPNIFVQASDDLRMNALRANRAQGFK